MNHGKCKNCWWYKMLHGDGYEIIANKVYKTDGNGICYMHTVNPGRDIEEPYHIDGDSWCPDYSNRERTNKRDKLTLDEWLNNLRKKYE